MRGKRSAVIGDDLRCSSRVFRYRKGLTTVSPKLRFGVSTRFLGNPPEDCPNPSLYIMTSVTPEFQSLADAITYFYENFSAPAPQRFERYLAESGNRQLEACAKYRWNLRISEALMPCFHATEVILRNSIHRAMVERYLSHSIPSKSADEWWFDVQIRGNELLNSRDREEILRVSDKIVKRGKEVTAPRIVAKLSFGFWVNLLNDEYEKSVVRPLLGTTFRKLKTGHRTQGWLRKTFGEILDLRNRAAHHEPIFHRTDLQHLNGLAWQMAREVEPWFVQPMATACRLDIVLAEGWKPTAETLQRQVNDLYQKFKKPA